MIIGHSFYLCFANVSLEGEFMTVLCLLDCALLCLKTKSCTSFFYNHNTRLCAYSSQRYRDTTGLTPQSGINYYNTNYANQNQNGTHDSDRSSRSRREKVELVSLGVHNVSDMTKIENNENLETNKPKELPSSAVCEKEPTYVNQGAVMKRKFSRPGYPVVIEYECDLTSKEKYKYHSGPREALCDDQGNWSFPSMFCVPTTCYTKVKDRFGRNSVLYGGDTHIEEEGGQCQAWKEDKPHKHSIKHTLHGACSGCGSVEDTGNKCRDMAHESKAWCYTMEPEVRYKYCDVPECTTERTCARPPVLRGASAVRTQLIGQKVHVTYKCHKVLKYRSGRNVSICDMETGTWDWPDLLCASEKCFYYDRDQWKGGVYLGTVSFTNTGRSCQRWDSQKPQKHDMTASRFTFIKSLSELGNICRDPDDEGAPWCYTTDRSKRWEFCPIPECNLDKLTISEQ